jgi:hypothetical protein
MVAVGFGCSQVTDPPVSARPVSMAEFARPTATAEIDPDDATRQPELATDARPGGPGADQNPALPTQAPAAPFDDPSGRTALWLTQPGESVIVDSLVGQVNGRPIFADEFLEPIEDRLLQAAEQTTGPQRDAAFKMIVNAWLRDVVIDALILSEAQASLSIDQQRGLFAFLRDLQEEKIRRSGGSRAQAERALESQGEPRLDEYLQDQKNLLIVDQLRRRRIEPRVIVSWRDIEREYQRRWEEFNPPATVTLARIRLHTESQAELVSQVTARLAGGEPFAEVAEELGFPDGGVWTTFKTGEGGITDIDATEDIKAALADLSAGETSPPFALGSATLWLHVVSVERPRMRDIYDPNVQRVLASEVRRRRSKEVWNQYIDTLLERGIYDELNEMAEELHRIALLRYGR